MEFIDWLEYEYTNDNNIEDDFDYYLARQKYSELFRPNIFFVGLNPRWQMYKFLPSGLNVMYSAAGFWDDEAKEWRRGAKFKKSFGFRFLDCGGFTMLNKHGEYPFSVVNYANLIARLGPDYYATMDYPCEPEISRSLSLEKNKERIEATVKNAEALAEWECQIPGKMVPVIQGYELDEYLYCLRLYEEADLIRDYMAVGSMCRRISDEQLGKLIPGLYYAANKLGCYKLHFFGLKLSRSLEIYADMIYSRDSAVAMDSYDKEIRARRGGRRFPRGQKEKEENFNGFISKIIDLNLNPIRSLDL